MKIIKIDSQNPDINIIKESVKLFKIGGVIIYPTDTCYGIGASALDDSAIKKVIKVKGRNSQNPFSIIVKDLKMARQFAKINKSEEEYFNNKLPGPYTLVFNKKNKLSDVLTAGLSTIGLRIPGYPVTQLISDFLGIPYITTSANIAGRNPSYSLVELFKQFRKSKIIDLILDAGRLPICKVSKVIDLSQGTPKILRA